MPLPTPVLTDGTVFLPEPLLTYCQLGSAALAGGKLHRIYQNITHKTVSEIKRFKIAATYLGSQWVNNFRLFLPWPVIIHCDFIEENVEPHSACLRHARFIIVPQNSPVSQQFPPSSEQPIQRILAHKLWPIAIFHKYCCYTKRRGIITSMNLRNHQGYITDASKYYNEGYRAWIIICFMLKNKKQIASLTRCYNPPLVHNKPLGAPTVVGVYILSKTFWNVVNCAPASVMIRILKICVFVTMWCLAHQLISR